MLYWAQNAQAAQQVAPGVVVVRAARAGGRGCSAPALALLNFGIDEYVNPRLRAAGITGRRARRAGLPRRPHLGLTPVTAPEGAS